MRGGKSTSSAGLPFLPALQNLIFQFLGAFLVFLVAALAEFPNALQEIVHVFGPVRVCGGGHDSRRALPNRCGELSREMVAPGECRRGWLKKGSGRVGGEDPKGCVLRPA